MFIEEVKLEFFSLSRRELGRGNKSNLIVLQFLLSKAEIILDMVSRSGKSAPADISVSGSESLKLVHKLLLHCCRHDFVGTVKAGEMN